MTGCVDLNTRHPDTRRTYQLQFGVNNVMGCRQSSFPCECHDGGCVVDFYCRHETLKNKIHVRALSCRQQQHVTTTGTINIYILVCK